VELPVGLLVDGIPVWKKKKKKKKKWHTSQ
jgi:hypothetical protein